MTGKHVRLPLSSEGNSQNDTFAILIQNVLTDDECKQLIEMSESHIDNYELASSIPEQMVFNHDK